MNPAAYVLIAILISGVIILAFLIICKLFGSRHNLQPFDKAADPEIINKAKYLTRKVSAFDYWWRLNICAFIAFVVCCAVFPSKCYGEPNIIYSVILCALFCFYILSSIIFTITGWLQRKLFGYTFFISGLMLLAVPAIPVIIITFM